MLPLQSDDTLNRTKHINIYASIKMYNKIKLLSLRTVEIIRVIINEIWYMLEIAFHAFASFLEESIKTEIIFF